MERDKALFFVSLIRADSIRFGVLRGSKGKSVSDMAGYCFCWLDLSQLQDEWNQVLTLIHEAFHDDPSFFPQSLVGDLTSELAIDEKALECIRKYPEIFRYVVRELRKAKIIALKRSVGPPINRFALERFRVWLEQVERTGIDVWVRHLRDWEHKI